MPTATIGLLVSGGGEFAAVARRLRGAAHKDLRTELRRAVRKAAAPIPTAVRKSARSTLPKAGGLGDLVARSRISVRVNTGGATVGVRVVAKSPHDIAAMDRGRVRHPLYGNRRHWYAQAVTPGWWTTPVTELGEQARTDVVAAAERVARKIEG